jgi:hypothetical protein
VWLGVGLSEALADGSGQPSRPSIPLVELERFSTRAALEAREGALASARAVAELAHTPGGGEAIAFYLKTRTTDAARARRALEEELKRHVR